MKHFLKKSIFFNKGIFYLGYVIFKLFGKTPKVSHMSMINLYCLTNGHFLDKFNLNNKLKIKINSKIKSVTKC